MAQLIHGTTIANHIAIHAGNMADHNIATTSYVTTQINNLINGAPGALNTLDELAAALGDDANFATSITNGLAGKLSLTGGTMSGDLTLRYSAPSTDADDYNALTFGIGADDYIIKASSGRGVFGRSSYGWHISASSAFGVYSSGWQQLLGVQGDSGNVFNKGRLVVGGNFSNNPHSSVDSTRLHFGGGDTDANSNYYIGTNKENFGGTYTKLDLRWHTGIRMGAASVYGGIRFFSDQTLVTRIMSIGETDANIRIDNNLWIGGAGGWLTDLLAGKQAAGSYLTSLPSHNHDDRYYTESESDTRFVNASGDSMSGSLTLGAGAAYVGTHGDWTGEQNKIQWHSTHLYLQNTGGGNFFFRRADGINLFNLDNNGSLIISGDFYPNGQGSFYLKQLNSGLWTNGNFGADGDLYLGTRGVWLSSWLNQSVQTGASPTFANVSVNGHIGNNASQTRDKLRVWDSSQYAIGMKNGYSFGHIASGEYAMSFQMNDNSGRGFWWGDTSHSDAQGAAALTTDGRMNIATALSIGEGEAITSPSSTPLYVRGSTSGQEVFAVDGVNGRLFTVTDDLSDSLFSVNTIAGLPVIEAFANNIVNIGPYSAPVIFSASGIATPSHGTSANWFTAFNKRPTGIGFSGSSTKTLTLTLGDGSTLSAAFNDIDTDTNSDGQTLSISGSTLSISGGNSITIPSGGISQGTADGLYQPLENQRLSTGNSPTFVDIYANEWFRNNNANEGLYNQATGTHLYSSNGSGWTVTGSGGIVELVFRSNHQSTIRGYVYADTSNNIGFLTNDGNWGLQVDSSKNAKVFGYLTVGNGTSSDIYMTDSDEGTRRIHCNSNRIGFLTQDNSWGAYADDAGNWFAANLSGTNTGDQTNISGNAGTVTINYNNDSNSTYQILWGSGNSVYGTSQVYVNPSSDIIYARGGYISPGNAWGTGDSAFFPNGITTAGGQNWIYGATHIGNATGNGQGIDVSSVGSIYVLSANTSGAWGFAGRFVDRSNAANNYIPWSFENEFGNHSWGLVARFHIQQAGADKPAIQFTSAGSNERWSLGYCTGVDFNFRITQNQGFRTDGSGTSDGWGTERFRINTNGDTFAAIGGTLHANGNAVWHAGNDGAGSGLDADLLDGYHESAFFRDNQSRTLSVLQFTGVGGDSGHGNHSYAIYQGGGAWSPPFPDLHIGYHTGIKIGANTGYGGIRFYSDSDMATELFSVGNGDSNVRVENNLFIRSAGGWITDLLAGKQAAGSYAAASHTHTIAQVTGLQGALDGKQAAGSYLTTSGKAADSETVDGVDSSRIVFGDGPRASTNSGNMNDPNQKSGFHFAYDPTGRPYTEWWNWITIAGNSWQSSNNYQFQLAHDFHNDNFQVRRMTNGGVASWREVITSGNIGSQSVSFANTAARATRANGNFYIDDNYGNTVVGVYESTRLQGVWAMGDAYKLAADGTSASNHYGIAWSHPNHGGEAANLTDHGVLVQTAGRTRTAISSTIWCIGDIIAFSDARVKANVAVIDNPLERLSKVRGVTFTRIDLEDQTKRYTGVIAQEMREALPEAVSENAHGELSVSYGNTVGLLIESIKAQQAQIEELMAEVKKLKGE